MGRKTHKQTSPENSRTVPQNVVDVFFCLFFCSLKKRLTSLVALKRYNSQNASVCDLVAFAS